MSLTRFLPTPSDRMGILWSLLPIDGCVVLEYGPAGTTHFSMSLFGELGESQQDRLFTTHMSEDDVVMGDVARLEKAIVEIDRSFAPKVIFVVASSVAAVIGTDIKGVCSYMQEQVSAKLIAFEQGGFRGDYSVGLTEAYKLLVKELPVDEPEPQPDTVNLIGFSMGSYRALSDRPELERLLDEAFGLKIGACLCGETGIEKIEQMGGAAFKPRPAGRGAPGSPDAENPLRNPNRRGRALRLERDTGLAPKDRGRPRPDDQPRPPGGNRRKARGRFPIQDVPDDAAERPPRRHRHRGIPGGAGGQRLF